MATATILGHPTWVKVPSRGGAAVILLHGGMSSSASLLRSIGPGLATSFSVGAFDRRGHGRTADTPDAFSYESMADETIAFVEMLDRRVHLVGHSDGANVALLVAQRRPDLLKRVVAVGANFHYRGLVDFPLLEPSGPEFEEWALKYARHAPEGISHAAEVLRKTNEMFRTGPTMTTDDLGSITVPVLVMAGDDDVATLEHTTTMFESIPESQLSIVPGTSHALLKERPRECVRIIRRFLRQRLPVETYSPLRRAAAGGFPGE
jgi:pimeloyl-ACP methyl ester carboxylesterase